jgi:hypothetical protein
MATPPPQTKVWLYQTDHLTAFSNQYSSVFPALLELTDSTVRCTLTAKAGYSRGLARRMDMPDLQERLRAGEHVTVFEFRYNGYHINWPGFFSGTAFEIGQGNGPRWALGLVHPSDVVAVFREAGVRERWRQALDPTRQQWTLSTLPPPGWYPDPADARAERYWDGTRWTSFARPSPWRLDHP